MAQRFRVRQCGAGDLDRILEIERASFGREAYDRNLFSDYMRRCAGLFLVAESQAAVLGYLIACVRPGSGAEIVSIAVDPAARERRAATALMAGAVRRLRSRGVARIHLVVKITNEPARAFYNKCGFHKLRRMPRYYEDGADGLLLWRTVSPSA
jgi:[ribosomal protein S18]-alanine N-acetyltransferase